MDFLGTFVRPAKEAAPPLLAFIGDAHPAIYWIIGGLVGHILLFGVLAFVFIGPARRFLHRSGPSLRLGAVQLAGARSTAVAARGLRIERGTTVEVQRIEGVRLVVAPRSVTPKPTSSTSTTSSMGAEP